MSNLRKTKIYFVCFNNPVFSLLQANRMANKAKREKDEFDRLILEK